MTNPPRPIPKPDIRVSPYCPHDPTAKQALYMAVTEREALYGGAAGGGKSDALLMDALQNVHVGGYSALIVRRTYADLAKPGAVMDRAIAWLRPQGIHWDATDKQFTFPSGARLSFGYLARPMDRYQYQSAEYQYVGVDELTQFEEDDYLYLGSRLRRLAGVEVPLKMRGATNPGGIGHEWVRSRFIPWLDPQGRLLIPHRHDGEVRRFVPAKLRDNPHLDRDTYIAQLEELGPILMAQLLHGDWGARPPGEMFDRTWFGWVEELPADTRWCRAWDLAGTKKRTAGHDPDWTAGVLMGLVASHRIIVADVVRRRDTPGAIEELILATARADRMLGCATVRMEQEPGSSGIYVAEAYQKKLIGYDFEAKPATGAKSVRAVPFAQYAKRHLVDLVLAPWNSDYLSELEGFPQESLHDDQVDASSLAFQTLAGTPLPAGATVSVDPRHSPYHAPRRRMP